MKQNRAFLWFQNLMLISPAFFLLYLFRFQIGPLPSNVLELSFGVFFLIWLIGRWKGGFPRTVLSKWQLISLVLLLGAVTLSTAHTVFTGDSEAARSALGIWKGWFIFPACYGVVLISCFRGKVDLQKLIDASIGITALLAGLMVVQYFTGIFSEVTSTYDDRLVWPYLDDTGQAASGNYAALFLSPFLVLAWACFLKSSQKLDRWFYLSSILLLALAVFLTKSYGAWLALFISCGFISFLFVKDKRKWIVGPLIAALLVGGLYWTQKDTLKFQFWLTSADNTRVSSVSERLNIWRVSGDLIQHSPFWGVGLGQFQKTFALQAPLTLDRQITDQEASHALHPHNVYLMFWLSAGVLGLLSFLFFLAVLIFPLCKKQHEDLRIILITPLLYLLLHGMVDVFYWKNDLAYSFWFFTALLIIAQNLNLLSARVGHGIKKGRELGFPTANLSLDLDLNRKHGVYAVDVQVGKEKKKGLLYFGPRMTKGLPEDLVSEITILDFEGDLYDQRVTFTIGSFIRGPKSFDSEKKLKEQIERDVMVARNKRDL